MRFALLVAGFMYIGVSICAWTAANFAMYVWLRRQGARPSFLLSGLPAYLAAVYNRWVESNQEAPRFLRLAWRITQLNLIPTLLVFVLLLVFGVLTAVPPTE